MNPVLLLSIGIALHFCCTSSYAQSQAESRLQQAGVRAEGLGNYLLAEKYYQQIINASQHSRQDDQLPLECKIRLATCFLYQNNFESAEALYNELIHTDLSKFKIRPKSGADLLLLMNNFADQYATKSAAPWRERCLKHALAIEEKIRTPDSQGLIKPLNDLGIYHYLHGQYSQAAPLLRKKLKLTELYNESAVPMTLLNLADIEALLKHYPEAETLYKRAYPLWVRSRGPNDLSTASTARELGLMLMKQGKLADAQRWAQLALSSRRAGGGENNLEYSRDLFVMARIDEGVGDFSKAQEVYRESIASIQRIAGKSSMELIAPMQSLTNLSKKIGHIDEVATLRSQIDAIKAKNSANTSGLVTQDAM